MKAPTIFFKLGALLTLLCTPQVTHAALDTTPSTLVQAIRIKYCTPEPVLSILKTGPALVNVDAPQDYNYTITVTNISSTTALGVIVSDTLPSQVTFNSGSVSNGGSIAAVGQLVTATIGTLAPGEVVTVIINVHAASQPNADITNTAIASSSNAESVQSSTVTQIRG